MRYSSIMSLTNLATTSILHHKDSLKYCCSTNGTIRSIKSMTTRLHDQIKFFLKLRNMTSSELARKAKVSKATLSYWSSSSSSPRNLFAVKRVAEVFQTSFDNLVFGNGLEQEDANSRRQNFQNVEDLFSLKNDWQSGIFEVKIRKISQKDIKDK